MKLLTSNDIEWQEGMKFAVVGKSDNCVDVQCAEKVVLNDKEFTHVGVYGYASIFHYVVDRKELERKTVWDAVNQFKGEFEDQKDNAVFVCVNKDKTFAPIGHMVTDKKNNSPTQWHFVCTKEEFNQCVKEMSEHAGEVKNKETVEDVIFPSRNQVEYDKGMRECVKKIASLVGKSFGADIGYVDLPDVVDKAINCDGEWKNGDACLFDNRSGTFIGLTKDKEEAVVEIDNADMEYDIDYVDVSKLRKPETEAQKKERVRDEAIKSILEKYRNYAITENYKKEDWNIVFNVASCIVDACAKLPTESK